MGRLSVLFAAATILLVQLSLTEAKNARYVRIYQSGSGDGWLQISKLSVIDFNGVDIAVRKPTQASSVWAGQPGHHIPVDGHPGPTGHWGHPWNGRLAEHHSGRVGHGDFWMVDLQGTFDVQKVVYYNRVDCCQWRANGMRLQLLDANKNVVEERRVSSAMVQPFTFPRSVQLPIDFDKCEYLAANDDVMRAVVNGHTTAETHWLQYGHKEGRALFLPASHPQKLPAEFKSKEYLAANPDVRAAVNAKQMLACTHYLKWGFKENRCLTVKECEARERDKKVAAAQQIAREKEAVDAARKIKEMKERLEKEEKERIRKKKIQLTVSRMRREGAQVFAIKGPFVEDKAKEACAELKAFIASERHLEAAQFLGANWCVPGFISGSEKAKFPVSVPAAGCADSAGVISKDFVKNDLEETTGAAVCYGIKPEKSFATEKTILPFNAKLWDQPGSRVRVISPTVFQAKRVERIEKKAAAVAKKAVADTHKEDDAKRKAELARQEEEHRKKEIELAEERAKALKQILELKRLKKIKEEDDERLRLAKEKEAKIKLEAEVKAAEAKECIANFNSIRDAMDHWWKDKHAFEAKIDDMPADAAKEKKADLKARKEVLEKRLKEAEKKKATCVASAETAKMFEKLSEREVERVEKKVLIAQVSEAKIIEAVKESTLPPTPAPTPAPTAAPTPEPTAAPTMPPVLAIKPVATRAPTPPVSAALIAPATEAPTPAPAPYEGQTYGAMNDYQLSEARKEQVERERIEAAEVKAEKEADKIEAAKEYEEAESKRLQERIAKQIEARDAADKAKDSVLRALGSPSVRAQEIAKEAADKAAAELADPTTGTPNIGNLFGEKPLPGAAAKAARIKAAREKAAKDRMDIKMKRKTKKARKCKKGYKGRLCRRRKERARLARLKGSFDPSLGKAFMEQDSEMESESSTSTSTSAGLEREMAMSLISDQEVDDVAEAAMRDVSEMADDLIIGDGPSSLDV